MRKTEFVNYHYLVLSKLKLLGCPKLFYDVFNYIFDNYHFSLNFCNDLFDFINERSKNG